MRALISVSDKTGVVDFAKNLKALGWEVIATGGTMKLLADSGVEVINISDVTGFPEICDGRVKTLHPNVHGGLLARRDDPEHLKALKDNHIEFIDMVCVNLYPFRETISKPGVKMEDITEIYSHEQAIGQCSKFLNSLNGVRVIPCDNTAMAAKMVAEKGDRHAAAISSHPCAALYGLTCLNDSIQDSDNNYTRFICITKDPVIYAGANRISLIIAFDNRPGALYEILSKLAALDINMTKLESCPVAGSDFEFVFFLELDASVQDPSVLAMLEEMERSCAEFQFLGNYAEV